MMFITGPLYSGKRTFARKFRGSVIADVQDAAAEIQTPEQLEALARELAEYDIVIATEVGGGVVPMDAGWPPAPTAWCRCSAASRQY